MPTYRYWCNEHNHGWNNATDGCTLCKLEMGRPSERKLGVEREDGLPNQHLLRGVACPACGFTDRFLITSTAIFVVTDHAAGDHGDVEWDERSPIFCPRCHQKGTVAEFEAIVRTG